MPTRFAYFKLLESDEPLLKKLPKHWQVALRHEGSQLELAKQWDVAVGTVKSRTHRARVALSKLREEAK